jgi:peptidyl-prolyl cis-trans isomerase A (cyclophilin A)
VSLAITLTLPLEYTGHSEDLIVRAMHKLTLIYFVFLFLASSRSSLAFADQDTAAANMENTSNPLVLLSTSSGDIYIELFPSEAPKNVENFLALAHGEKEFKNPNSGKPVFPRYFDGMEFHRVIPENFIQVGSPLFNPLGYPEQLLDDEINADLLGLNQQSVIDELGNFNALLNIAHKNDFQREILNPILEDLRITTEEQIIERQYELYQLISELSLKEVYEYQGYQYQDNFATREITRSIVALANTGPDTNGPEFFIAIQDLHWLNGKHTVIGKVVEGMNTVDIIGRSAIEPLLPSQFSTLIYSLRQVN